jgi:SAM-dependent methyltransferase
MSDALARERAHQDDWYARAIATRFFEREGFRRLTAWNLDRLKQVVPFSSSSRVLSLGCGTGEYELALAPSVAHVAAIDLSPVAITEARRRALERQLGNIDFIEASILDLSLPPAAFDVVYALGVLHHLSLAERHALLIHVRQWLAAGGCFYARDPNARGLLRLAGGWWARRSPYHSPNEAALDPRELRQELRAAGFQEPVIGYTDVLGGPLPWILPSPSPGLWSAVFIFDRVWLAIPGLRRGASQFDVRALR